MEKKVSPHNKDEEIANDVKHDFIGCLPELNIFQEIQIPTYIEFIPVNLHTVTLHTSSRRRTLLHFRG